MEQIQEKIKTMLELMKIGDYRIEAGQEENRIAIYIYDESVVNKANTPHILESINHLAQLFNKKSDHPPIFIDINNYRRERERIITELARAAAKKVLTTKEKVSLPAMNAYERRLIHVELSMHPEVTTESMGMGKNRYVIVRLLDETQ